MADLVSMSSFLTTENNKKYLESLLGDKTQAFITSLSTMVGSNATLNKCDRASLLGCALKATSMNLPFDQNLGFAYAVPYANKAQFQMGYKGFIQLAQRSSQIQQLNAREVVEGEYKGDDIMGEPVIEWLPVEEREDKSIVGYMAGMKLVNGFTKIIYWSKVKIEKHADRYSQAYRYAKKVGQKDAVWINNFDAMAKKTVLKDLISKYAPMSVEMQQAIKYDQSVILTDPDTGTEEVLYVDNPEEIRIETISKEQQEEIAKTIRRQ
jgi:recombination protein RecT